MAVVISSASASDDPASDLCTRISRRLCVEIIAHSVNDDGSAQNLIDAEAVGHKRQKCPAARAKERRHIACMIGMRTTIGIVVSACIGEGIAAVSRACHPFMNMKAYV